MQTNLIMNICCDLKLFLFRVEAPVKIYVFDNRRINMI